MEINIGRFSGRVSEHWQMERSHSPPSRYPHLRDVTKRPQQMCVLCSGFSVLLCVMDFSPLQIMGMLSLFLCFGFVTAGTYTSLNLSYFNWQKLPFTIPLNINIKLFVSFCFTLHMHLADLQSSYTQKKNKFLDRTPLVFNVFILFTYVI